MQREQRRVEGEPQVEQVEGGICVCFGADSVKLLCAWMPFTE